MVMNLRVLVLFIASWSFSTLPVLGAPLLLDCSRSDWQDLPPVVDARALFPVTASDLQRACQGLPRSAGPSACDFGNCCPLGRQASAIVGDQVEPLHGTSNADGLLQRIEDGVILRVGQEGIRFDTFCGMIGGEVARVAPPPPPPVPDTEICRGPTAPSSDPDPDFEFFDPTGVAVSFECSRDGGAWATCSSPASWGLPLGPGPDAHRFAARGVTPDAGADPTPAQWRWIHVADLLFGSSFEAMPACP